MKFISQLKLLCKVSPKGVVFTTLTALVSSFEASILALATIEVVDAVKSDEGLHKLAMWIIIIMIYFLFKAMLSALNQVALNGWLFEESNANLKVLVNEKIGKMSLLHFEEAGFLDDLEKATEVVECEKLPLLYYRVLQIGQNVVSVVLLLSLLMNYHKLLCFCLVIIAIPIFLTKSIRGNAMFQCKIQQANENRRLKEYRSWFLNPRMNKELRATNSDGYILSRWKEIDQKHRYEVARLKKKDAASAFLCQVLRASVMIGVTLFTVNLGVKGEVSAAVVSGALIAFFSAQNEVTSLFEKMGSLTELFKMNEVLIDFLKEDKVDRKYNSIESIEKISLKDVHFSYPNAEGEAIQGINLTIGMSERIAVVGVNGSGKTTLGKLLLGIYEVTKGEININGTNIDTIDKKSFWKKVAMVPQVIPRFKCAVKDYLFLETKEYNEEAIMNVMDKSGLPLVRELGLDKRLGAEFDGVELSGGQWQSLLISAAWIKNADLYVLDEATSAIDPLKESEILSNFLNMTKGRMAMIITHRLSICPWVDRIIYMDKGKIIEEGTHDELMKLRGVYYEMYSSQARNQCI